MQKLAYLVLLTLFVLTACQPTTDDALPTLAELPTQEASPTLTQPPTETNTPEPTPTPQPTETLTPSPTITNTPAPTNTPRPTLTASPTRTPIPAFASTAAAASTATAIILERPTLSTFTPIPPGVTAIARPTSTGTPEVNADVIITEIQLQEEVDRIIADNPNIAVASVSVIDGGIDLVLTSAGDEVATGTLFVSFDMSIIGVNNVLIAQPVPPDQFRMIDGEAPSEAFIGVAYNDLVPALFQAFDDILNQRLGQGQHDLENVTFIQDAMLITLVVPLSN